MDNQHDLNLARSIVIHMPEVATFINAELDTRIGFKTSSDKRTWKYYLNMAGLPHQTNNPILLRSLDSKEIFELTRDNLRLHPITQNELKKFGDFFRTISQDSGGQDSFLRGIINPIPLDDSIYSEPQKILYYDKTLVSTREHHLIPELEDKIRAFMNRWFDPLFTFEDRYVPTILAQVYAVVILNIPIIRKSVVNTEKASDLDIKEYFRNNLQINDLLDYVNDDAMLWLYSNIKYVMRNIGKDVVLQDVIDNVLTPSGISVYNLQYSSDGKELIEDNTNVNKRPWIHNLTLDMVGRNKGVEFSPRSITEDRYLDLQANFTGLKANKVILEKKKVVTVTKNLEMGMQTKSLMLDHIYKTQSIGYDIFEVLLENWFYDSLSGINLSTFTFNITKNVERTMNAELAVKTIIYLMSKMSNIEPQVRAIRLDSVIRHNSLSEVVLLPNSRGVGIKQMVEDVMPLKAIRYYSDTYPTYVREVATFFSRLWTIESNLTEEINRMNFKRVREYMFYNDSELRLNDKNEVEDLELLMLKEELSFDESTYEEAFTNILKTFVSPSIVEGNILSDKLQIFKKFLNKVISYNLQILSSISEETIVSNQTSTNIIRGLDSGYILNVEANLLTTLEHTTTMEMFDEENKIFEVSQNANNVTIEHTRTTPRIIAETDKPFTVKSEHFISNVMIFNPLLFELNKEVITEQPFIVNEDNHSTVIREVGLRVLIQGDEVSKMNSHMISESFGIIEEGFTLSKPTVLAIDKIGPSGNIVIDVDRPFELSNVTSLINVFDEGPKVTTEEDKPFAFNKHAIGVIYNKPFSPALMTLRTSVYPFNLEPKVSTVIMTDEYSNSGMIEEDMPMVVESKHNVVSSKE